MELRIDRQALVPVVQQIVDALTCGFVATRYRRARVCPRCGKSRGSICSVNPVSSRPASVWWRKACWRRVMARGSSSPLRRRRLRRNRTSRFEGAEVNQGRCLGGLKLGCGGLPESWRETDDLSYAIREVTPYRHGRSVQLQHAAGLASVARADPQTPETAGYRVRRQPHLTTTGASQGLDLIVRTLFKPGDCVVVESPGYPLLFDLLRLHGVNMIEVPRTPRGPDMKRLRRCC